MPELYKEIENIAKEEELKEKSRLRIVAKHISSGVVFTDWKSVYIDEEVSIGKGTLVEPGVMIRGKSIIGENCTIGSNSKIVDSQVMDGASIQYSIIVESSVGKNTNVGPFAYLRPNSQVGDNVKIGDFVEVKNSTIGSGTKISHLTYVGDADLGPNVNLGCGVVFVNYDGYEKRRSSVEKDAFIGCNVNLVAPLTIGEDAYIAAGTTVTKNVPPSSLCIGRPKERVVLGWTAKKRSMAGKDKNE